VAEGQGPEVLGVQDPGKTGRLVTGDADVGAAGEKVRAGVRTGIATVVVVAEAAEASRVAGAYCEGIGPC
jgi:hypothetical protein